jgi:hypothetical protein
MQCFYVFDFRYCMHTDYSTCTWYRNPEVLYRLLSLRSTGVGVQYQVELRSFLDFGNDADELRDKTTYFYLTVDIFCHADLTQSNMTLRRSHGEGRGISFAQTH